MRNICKAWHEANIPQKFMAVISLLVFNYSDGHKENDELLFLCSCLFKAENQNLHDPKCARLLSKSQNT